MKKTMTLVLLGILAVVLIGYAVISVTTDKPETASTTAENSTDIQAETSAAEVTMEQTTKKGFFENLFSDEKETEKQTEATTANPYTGGEKIEDYAYAYAGFEPAYANMDLAEWNLILVNRDYILPDGYMPRLAPSITDNPDSLKLDYRVAPYYNEMYLAALEDGVELTPVSGYRSVERQTNNFENKIQIIS